MKQQLKERILREFEEMRNLMGYAQVWRFHPAGAAKDIKVWLLQAFEEVEAEAKIQGAEELFQLIDQEGHSFKVDKWIGKLLQEYKKFLSTSGQSKEEK